MKPSHLVTVTTALVAACGAKEPPPPSKHVVLVTIDTLRADHLGVYGSTDVATPNLDRLASEGAMARNAVVHAPLTRPSHVPLFTGRLPSEHGIRDNVSPAIAEDETVLAEVLQRNGFSTAGFVSSVVLSRQSGLARGFDHYSDSFEGVTTTHGS